MVTRTWRARASDVTRYVGYFEHTLVPELRKIPGHRGALVTTNAGEIVVTTFWDSMQAIAGFADPIEVAVVEPEARQVLDSFDNVVSHADVAVNTFS